MKTAPHGAAVCALWLWPSAVPVAQRCALCSPLAIGLAFATLSLTTRCWEHVHGTQSLKEGSMQDNVCVHKTSRPHAIGACLHTPSFLLCVVCSRSVVYHVSAKFEKSNSTRISTMQAALYI